MDTRPTVTPEMIRLYDDYTHVSLDRRRFMASLSQLAGGSAAAAALVPLLAANAAAADQIAPDDPRLTAETVRWQGGDGPMQGYLVRPAGIADRLPGVLVLHENRGLNAHIRDVTRRVALEGFMALAPDLLAPAGGTPADEDAARAMIQAIQPEALTRNLRSSVAYLLARPDFTRGIGVVGFCWGGGAALQLAVAEPALTAAVSYYGMQPPASDVPRIKAQLLLQYAGLDERINAGIPAFQAALDAAGTRYQIFVYEGANHAFNNDTSAARYDPAAARLAWDRTIAFLHQALGGA
ncbi:MAG: dienelactone hydrolase family protein [Amaricoccus sp.]